MAGEWLECVLADVCSSIDYGLTASASEHEVGPRFLRITDIVKGQIDWNSVPHVATDDATAAKYKLAMETLCLLRTGASTGASAFVRDPPPAVFASYLVRLRAKPEIDARFLYYYLRSDNFWTFIRGVIGDKSAQPECQCLDDDPSAASGPKSKGEQRAIAHILGTLDDKIELNRRMSETLEAMARALFKSWFVDFDPVRAKAEGGILGFRREVADLFPARLVDSDFGEIPEGFEVGCVDDEFELTMGQSPPGETYNESEEGLPFFQGSSDFGCRFPTRRIYCTAPTRFAKRGDTLISVRAPVGDINMAWEDCAIGRGVAAAIHRTGSRSYTFQFMRSLERVFARFEAEGTVFGSIGKKDFHGVACVVPPRNLVITFEKRAASVDSRIEVNEREARVLSALRDTLLPKLISGELRVPDAERFVEKALADGGSKS